MAAEKPLPFHSRFNNFSTFCFCVNADTTEREVGRQPLINLASCSCR